MAKQKKEQVLVTYKGFRNDLTCRDFQYEIGKTYEAEGKIEACGNGFHACEYPLDIFGYYAPAGSRFALVEQSGDLSREAGGDTKVASRKITIKAELTIAGLVKAAIEYTTSRAKPIDPNSPASATGRYSAASATGVRGAARGIEGSALLLLLYRDESGSWEDQTYGRIVHARAVIVGQDGIKPDTWYSLDEDGNVVEVEA
ncbi:hypothetical protein G3T20_05440 [Bordetella hinzii]|uniref:DUF7666 domain-containing protein n=1 Tax=Bordetella hinzii TaxID=103855 RepID=UPI0013EFFDD8|nr:hypothetical protein [Bordetella hinzii]QII84194.1 hypothetical protein G3T20_05440 [Bordetella hinzii]